MVRTLLVSLVTLAGSALAACSPAAKETPPVFGDIPAEPPGRGGGPEQFTLDPSQEGVVTPQGPALRDGGLAWCTSPSPEQVRTTTDLSPTTTLRVYSGGCVPSGGDRACDDAGMAIYAPTCDAANTGKRLEIVTSGKKVVSIRADSVDVVPGPLAGGTWAVGPSQRAVLINTDAKVGSGVEHAVRVAAVTYKADDWREPAEDFAELVANTKTGTFTFWRKAVCIASLGCTIARWEASKSGVRISGAEKDLYKDARNRLRTDMAGLRAAAPACPSEAILTAAKIYALGRISGEAEGAALREFDKLVAGLSTTDCPATPTGKPKPVQGIRTDLAAGVWKALTTKGSAR